jgi:hypothetical protein
MKGEKWSHMFNILGKEAFFEGEGKSWIDKETEECIRQQLWGEYLEENYVNPKEKIRRKIFSLTIRCWWYKLVINPLSLLRICFLHFRRR